MTHAPKLSRRSMIALALAAMLSIGAEAPAEPTPVDTSGDRIGIIRAAHESATLRPALRGAALAVEEVTVGDLPTGTDSADLGMLPGPVAHPEPAPAQLEGVEVHFPQEIEVTRFVNSWGFARGNGRAHRGTDLMAPKMTEVYALADGTVTRMGEGRTAGRMLAIDHGNGYTSWYMHLNDDTPGTDNGMAPPEYTYAPGLAVGAEVETGQLIGYVGDSGNAEWGDPHIHFELHQRGRAINPYRTLVAAHEHCDAVAADEERIRRYRELTEIAD